LLQFGDLWLNIVFWVIIGLAIAGAITLQIYIIVWVYRDAKKRNMDETIWLLIVIILGLVGLIIYLIVREPLVAEKSQQPIKVATAQSQDLPTPVRQENATKFCSACGAKIPVDAEFCSFCGTKFSD